MSAVGRGRRQQRPQGARQEQFRVLTSALAIRPVWHRLTRWVEAHILTAFLGSCLWMSLNQKLHPAAPSLSPARVLEIPARLQLVEAWSANEPFSSRLPTSKLEVSPHSRIRLPRTRIRAYSVPDGTSRIRLAYVGFCHLGLGLDCSMYASFSIQNSIRQSGGMPGLSRVL